MIPFVSVYWRQNIQIDKSSYHDVDSWLQKLLFETYEGKLPKKSKRSENDIFQPR